MLYISAAIYVYPQLIAEMTFAKKYINKNYIFCVYNIYNNKLYNVYKKLIRLKYNQFAAFLLEL